MASERHRALESKSFRFTLLTLLTIAVGGLVLLIPPAFLQGTVPPLAGVHPYTALEQEGRDIYVREGCNVCHSQQVRPFKTETDRYGHYSVAGEGIYDRPFLWGSRRTGPDLARVGGKYPDSWHWMHLEDPRRIEPRSNMPAFAFLIATPLDTTLTSRKLAALRTLGAPYSDAEVEGAAASALAEAESVAAALRKDGIALDATEARSEAIAVIAYLQSLGLALRAQPMDTAMLEAR
ncbi:MAG: cytochrome-c oxidase, cbb3-type subunit II [Myxococcota bacterium]